MAQPLTLQISPGSWQLYMRRKLDPKFAPIMEKVFARDNSTCQYCGFQAQDYQEVINLDGNYNNNKVKNLATACCFCAQCLFVDMIGQGDYGGGTLMYLPEMSQARVNSFCHVLFCAMSNGVEYKASAQEIYRTMKMRSKLVERRLGDGSSDPAYFSRLAIESELTTESDSLAILKKLRVLPSRAKFRMQIERWAESALEEMGDA